MRWNIEVIRIFIAFPQRTCVFVRTRKRYEQGHSYNRCLSFGFSHWAYIWFDCRLDDIPKSRKSECCNGLYSTVAKSFPVLIFIILYRREKMGDCEIKCKKLLNLALFLTSRELCCRQKFANGSPFNVPHWCYRSVIARATPDFGTWNESQNSRTRKNDDSQT